MQENEKKTAEYSGLRRLTIGTIARTPGLGGKRVPYIRLCGNWLKKCGFRPEGRVTVTTTHEQLIIRAKR